MVKTIHCIWFGENPKSKLVKKCIASWEKNFPDWEIKEWNESNLDLDAVPYCRQAYDCKKYAFVSDYFRFQILYQYGGLYLDTDVEVLHPLIDLLETNDILLSFENENYVNPGLICFASQPGLDFFGRILDSYDGEIFLRDDGSFNLFTVCERVSIILREYGFQMNGSLQVIGPISIYPHDYFCPTDYVWSRQDFTANTRSIHHYDSSWLPPRVRRINKMKKAVYRVLKPQLVKGILREIRRIQEITRWAKN